MNRPETDYGPDRPILHVLAGIAGFAISLMLPVQPPMIPSSNDWAWIEEYVKFSNRHSILLAGLVLVALGWRFRNTRARPVERSALAFIFGGILAGLLKGEIRGF